MGVQALSEGDRAGCLFRWAPRFPEWAPEVARCLRLSVESFLGESRGENCPLEGAAVLGSDLEEGGKNWPRGVEGD